MKPESWEQEIARLKFYHFLHHCFRPTTLGHFTFPGQGNGQSGPTSQSQEEEVFPIFCAFFFVVPDGALGYLDGQNIMVFLGNGAAVDTLGRVLISFR